MKIALLLTCDPSLNKGGVEEYVNSLNEALSSKDHEVDVYSSRGEVSGHLKLTWRTLSYSLTPLNLKEYDLVISNTHHLRPLVKARRFVSVFHGSGLQRVRHNPLTIFYPYTLVDCLLEFLDLSFTEDIVCINRDLEKFLSRFKDESRLHVVYPGVDTELFKPKKARIDDKKHVLFVGRVSESKGFPELLEAVDYLPDDWVLDVVGEPKAEDTERIRYHGWVDKKDLPQYYNRADVFCLPSRQEGTPLTVLESMACGTPVAASSVGGIPEIIGEKTGVLVEELTSEEIAQAIQEASFLDPDRIRDEALDYGWGNVADKLVDI